MIFRHDEIHAIGCDDIHMKNLFLYGQNDIHDDVYRHDRGGGFLTTMAYALIWREKIQHNKCHTDNVKIEITWSYWAACIRSKVHIEVKASELQKIKLFVATPMYGGQCAGMYSKACIDLLQCVQTMELNVDFSLYSMNHLSQEQEIIL